VIAIIAILAALLLPALGKAKQKASQVRCISNLRQLGLGTHMYLDDNRGIFPACGSRNTYGFHKEDWIYWRTAPGYPPVQQSPIAVGLGNIDSNLFRCPMDRDNKARGVGRGKSCQHADGGFSQVRASGWDAGKAGRGSVQQTATSAKAHRTSLTPGFRL